MARFEGVVHILEWKGHLRRFPGCERLRMLIAIAKTSAHHLAADHHLISSQSDMFGSERFIRLIVGIDIYHLYDPVGIGSSGGNKELSQ